MEMRGHYGKTTEPKCREDIPTSSAVLSEPSRTIYEVIPSLHYTSHEKRWLFHKYWRDA